MMNKQSAKKRHFIDERMHICLFFYCVSRFRSSYCKGTKKCCVCRLSLLLCWCNLLSGVYPVPVDLFVGKLFSAFRPTIWFCDFFVGWMNVYIVIMWYSLYCITTNELVSTLVALGYRLLLWLPIVIPQTTAGSALSLPLPAQPHIVLPALSVWMRW